MRTALLNAVVIKGVAETDAVADATDVATDEAGRILAELAEEGLIRHRTGRLTGWSPTAEGRAERARLMRAERLDEAPEDAYLAFVTVNGDLKRLCTTWQTLRPTITPDITDQLTAIHHQVREVIDSFAKAQARFAAYGRRLDAARERFVGGDPTALTAARADSYHGVWMELHADILATLDRPRTALDGA